MKLTTNSGENIERDQNISKKNWIILTIFLLYIFGIYAVFNNTTGMFFAQDSANSPIEKEIFSDPDNSAVLVNNTAANTEPVTGNYNESLEEGKKDTFENNGRMYEKVIDQDGSVSYKDVFTGRNVKKIVTSEGEIYGQIIRGVVGSRYFEVETDGKRLPDYKFVCGGAGEERFNEAGLGEVYYKYNIHDTITEKFNTDGKPGYDKVKVYILQTGGFDMSILDAEDGLLVYEGVHINNWDSLDYIGRCYHLNDEKWIKYISDDVRNGCIKDLSK